MKRKHANKVKVVKSKALTYEKDKQGYALRKYTIRKRESITKYKNIGRVESYLLRYEG